MREQTKKSEGSGEFALIEEFFSGRGKHHSETILGIGDDAAILSPPAGKQLVLSVDTMVEGVHFLPDTDPKTLGHKLLAVNLSDLAAMGAEPLWVTLALTIPENNPEWLGKFSQGLFALADRFRVDLVGGDTTRGPLVMTLQIYGIVDAGAAVCRSSAQAGDLICVTNTLGAAGLALRQLQAGGDAAEIRHYLETPAPRIDEGILLRDYATSMVDISDGLMADLGHILGQSGVGATVNLDAIPMHSALSSLASVEEQIELAMTAGDDYELCFTIPEQYVPVIRERLSSIGSVLSIIGIVAEAKGISLVGEQQWFPEGNGFQHF